MSRNKKNNNLQKQRQRKQFANATRRVFVNKYREIRAAGFARATYI